MHSFVSNPLHGVKIVREITQAVDETTTLSAMDFPLVSISQRLEIIAQISYC
jgi:hypothetical protein